MPRRRLRPPVALALLLLAGGAGPASAVQPGGAPDELSYRSALGGLWNYRSCGAGARAADCYALEAELRSIEALARSKGLGPTLERVREEYQRLLAVSSTMACVRGPVSSLADARRAMAAFRAWVVQAPVHRLTRAEAEAEATREVLAADDSYAAAVLARDDAALRRILDEHFAFDSGDGRATGPDGLRATLRALNLIGHRMVARTVVIRGNVGTVAGTAELASASATQSVITRLPYTATWEKRGGVWRLAALHMALGARR
jgi:ketosteroid isomerase-like protein